MVKILVYSNYIDEVLFRPLYIYYVHDHLYSPVALVLQTGTVLERYEYDAYGNCHVLEPNFAPDSDGQSDYANPYLFTGRRVDILDSGSLKIQYNRNRYYDYYTGRWLTQDPSNYVDSMNLYEYCASNPFVGADPWGLLAISLFPPLPIRIRVPTPVPIPITIRLPRPTELIEEIATKALMYRFARTVLIKDEHWRDLLDAWYHEEPPPTVFHRGFGWATCRDIAWNAGFRALLECWVAKNYGCNHDVPERGKHFKINKHTFFWHYYYPHSSVPGGSAAYTSATNFLGSYTAQMTVKKEGPCFLDIKVAVKNDTTWRSASRTLRMWPFPRLIPSYPAHERKEGPYWPSTGGRMVQRYAFRLKRVPITKNCSLID
ncbi:MAG: RHS repeat-associated core domain-containing protein [Sedimentisphaerales bacterium]